MTRPLAPFLAAVLGLSSAPVAAQDMAATVLGQVVLPEVEMNGMKLGELSGIRWSEEDGLLYAVSDKARLVTLRLEAPADDALALEPVAILRLIGANGDRIDDDVFNPEALELAGSELLLVSEAGPAAAFFDLDGRWLRDAALPQPVRDPAVQRSEGDGVESAALHPVHGLLVALEEPRAADKREFHTIFAEDGRTFSFDTSSLGDNDNTSIKDMAVLPDGAVLILERQRAENDSLIPYLRRLDPATCPADPAAPCPTSLARIDVPDFTDADFEGLAPLGSNRFLLVSDDKVDGNLRSVFALVELSGV